jgi:hypothetical protein
MEPFIGGRAYYELPSAAKQAVVVDKWANICRAQTAKGKRCKHDVSEIEPARGKGVCQMHCTPNVIYFADAHPKRAGPGAPAPNEFNVFFFAGVSITDKDGNATTYVARSSQMISNVKPALQAALLRSGVPDGTWIEMVDIENAPVEGCLGGPYAEYGSVDSDGKPWVPEEYCIAQVHIANPNKEAYATAAGFFGSSEGSALVKAMNALSLGGPGYDSWTMPDGSAAAYQFTAMPDMVGGGPCSTKRTGKGVRKSEVDSLLPSDLFA